MTHQRDNILVVDSDPNFTPLYQLIFRDNYNLFVANRTADAFNILKENEIKVAIVENVLVSESALLFFEKLKVEYSFCQPILITDYNDTQFIMRAINHGQIFNYLSKPFDHKHILRVVQNAVDQYDLQKNNRELLTHLTKKNNELEGVLIELQHEEEKSKAIFNASPDPIFIVDHFGNILNNNEPAAQFFNHNKKIASGSPILTFIHPEDHQKMLRYVHELNANSVVEIQMMAQNDVIKDFEIKGYPFLYAEKKAYMLTLRDISVRKEMENKVLQSVISTEEKERRRFAQELHDGIGPLLSTTKLYLQWFNKPDSKMDKAYIITKMEETLEETIASLREVSNNISPNTLINFGLNAALRTFINRIGSASNVNFIFNNSLSVRLSSELEVTIYRLICECINNSIKHAQASKIIISIVDESDFLYVKYQDNGIGFNSEEKLHAISGSGLINMKTRVNSLGGNINITSAPGNGTEINVDFNLKSKNLTSKYSIYEGC